MSRADLVSGPKGCGAPSCDGTAYRCSVTRALAASAHAVANVVRDRLFRECVNVLGRLDREWIDARSVEENVVLMTDEEWVEWSGQ